MLPYRLHQNTKTALWIITGTLIFAATTTALLNIRSSATPIAIQHDYDDSVVYMLNDGTDMEIFVLEEDGCHPSQLTNNDYDDWAPVWTPDKTQIVFHATREGDSGVFIMNRDGTNLRRITPMGVYAQFPSVSPDGRMIAFEVFMPENGGVNIFMMPLSGSYTMQQLTYGQAHDGGAAWSPDGTQIAFHSTREGYYDIYSINLDGTNLERLTYYPDTMDVWPQWSPDGSQILFHSERDMNSEIYVMNNDGTSPRNLTNDVSLDRVPRWLQDGEHIVFRSEREGMSQIYIMNIADGWTAPITSPATTAMHPDS